LARPFDAAPDQGRPAGGTRGYRVHHLPRGRLPPPGEVLPAPLARPRGARRHFLGLEPPHPPPAARPPPPLQLVHTRFQRGDRRLELGDRRLLLRDHRQQLIPTRVLETHRSRIITHPPKSEQIPKAIRY